MKERRGRNRIDRLINDADEVVDNPAAIELKVVSFYRRLLGSKCTLKALDPRVLAKGNSVSRDDVVELPREVTKSEIDSSMLSINDDKSPGLDGFNARFFKICWLIIKENIYEAVLNSFTGKASLRYWNGKTITLIPKVAQASRIKDFRPISCCSVVYKIVVKVLAVRLQGVLPKNVSHS